jgi:glutathione S-transferase
MQTPPLFEAYVLDVSYFSGKLEAYLRYKQIPFRRIEVGWRRLTGIALRHTGMLRVPLVRTPTGEWLADTTPMIDWFEERFPEGRVLPDDPEQAFFVRLVEDYADEWMWRPALHYRWSYPDDARLLSRRIAREALKDVPLPLGLKAWNVRRRQRKLYVAGDGVRRETRDHVEAIYLGALDRLQSILSGQRYLLGDRPCLADFGFFASMFRHFSIDPTPARIMRERAPAVYAWVSRLWNAQFSEEKGEWAAPGTLPQGWEPLLADIAETHLRALHANALAWRYGRQRFDLQVQGVPYRDLPTVQYRVWCRERLQEHYVALPKGMKPRVRSTLEKCGAWDPLWDDGVIASHLHEGGEPALCRPPQGRARLRLLTSPWNPVAGPRV